MKKFLKKDDAIVILYDKCIEDDFYYPIRITSKGGADFYQMWLSFKTELAELDIVPYDHLWICENETFNNSFLLQNELLRRGYNVEMGGKYEE